MTLFDRVFGGNDYNYARTVAAIDEAIATYGESEAVSFPGTAYSLPCYYAVTGVKISNLGEMKAAMAKAKELDKLIGWDFNWQHIVGAHMGLKPGFEYKVLDVHPDGTQRVQNGAGLIEKIKPGVTSIPSEDDYLCKDRDAFETLYRPKMQFDPARINLDFFKHARFG